MSGIMEGPPRYPLEILPKEIWEMIILEVKDSENLRNLMKASKQLNDSFRKIRHLWLLDKVLPILTTLTSKKKPKRYLKGKDVLKLRLVDKRWCAAVNTFLENQPNLRPYNKDDDKLNSEAHIWCHRAFFDSRTIWRVTLKNEENQLSDLGETFEALQEFGCSERNPFPSRSIVRYPLEGGQGNVNLWGELDEGVSQKLGKHVWFLDLEWSWPEHQHQNRSTSNSAWKLILQSFASLPNLKGLQLYTKPPFKFYAKNSKFALNIYIKQFLKLRKNQLPSMPFLESLQICYFFPALFSQQLMSKYYLQLRRLEISVPAWESREKWVFPNLTDFCLDYITTGEEVTQILMNMEAPQLVKLQLASWGGYPNLKLEEDVFQCIAHFPSLLYLDISDYLLVFSENEGLEPSRDSMPNLKYLKIHNSPQVNYNFLRCLPSLQRLQICVDEEPVVWDCSAYPEVRIKLELETYSLYESNVWELCPKLKTLVVYHPYVREKEDEVIYYEFDRETYEKLRNSPEPDFQRNVKLRREINIYLYVNDTESQDGEDSERYRLL